MSQYAVEGEWLVEVSEECTCGVAGLGYGHEPTCGMTSIGKVEDLITKADQADKNRRENDALWLVIGRLPVNLQGSLRAAVREQVAQIENEGPKF